MAKAQLPTYPSTTTAADEDLFHLNQAGLDKKLTTQTFRESIQTKATETSAGIAELATQAEVDAGLDDERIVTALKLASILPVQSSPTVSGIVELALDSEAIAGVDTDRALTPSNVEAKIAEETELGIIEIADSTEIVAGIDNTKVISPYGLDNLQVSTDQASLIEIATQTEADAGNDNTKAITPQTMTNAITPDASTVLRGKIELATQAEVDAGVDDERAITPLKMAGVFGLMEIATASETVKGIAELSTQLETDSGADDERIITPLKLESRQATEALTGVIGLAIDPADTLNLEDTITPKDLSDTLYTIATEVDIGITELATLNEVIGGTSTSRSVTPAGLSNRAATTVRNGVVSVPHWSRIRNPAQSGVLETPITDVINPKALQELSDTAYATYIVNTTDRIFNRDFPNWILGGGDITLHRIKFISSDFTANKASKSFDVSTIVGQDVAVNSRTRIVTSTAALWDSPTKATDDVSGALVSTRIPTNDNNTYEVIVDSSRMSIPTNGFQVNVFLFYL